VRRKGERTDKQPAANATISERIADHGAALLTDNMSANRKYPLYIIININATILTTMNCEKQGEERSG
jgi:hypothetical protein